MRTHQSGAVAQAATDTPGHSHAAAPTLKPPALQAVLPVDVLHLLVPLLVDYSALSNTM